jgi:hypothetical protein
LSLDLFQLYLQRQRRRSELFQLKIDQRQRFPTRKEVHSLASVLSLSVFSLLIF